jgi:DNA-binding CsgD family transcriptional regulator
VMPGEYETIYFSDMKEKIFKNHSANLNGISKEQDLEYEIPENNTSTLFSSCFVDPSGRQFACIHDNCSQKSSCFNGNVIQKKIDIHELQFHSEDRALWCHEVVPDIISFIESEPVAKLQDYRFIFNHRYLRKDGSVTQFMHEGSLSITEIGTPILKLTVFFEVGDIVSDETIILKIFRYSAEYGYQKVFRKVYGAFINSLLTEREMEIIRLCHEGLSSKMIADKLNLSIHTVKNHKRNSMVKTVTHNITELIRLCIIKHWL